MLTHLLRAGWFDGVRGIAGPAHRLRDAGVVRGPCGTGVPLGVPTLFGVPTGHAD